MNSINTSTNQNILAFAADTQAPMLVETILLRPYKNKKATALLFEDVLKRKPAQFFLLGDVVNLGYSNRQWKPIDIYLQALKQKEIPVHAIMGNHEVMGKPKEGRRKFEERFPTHKHTGFVIKQGGAAVVLVNSNFKTLTAAEDGEQVNWFAATLAELDEDPSIQSVIIGCHHSPFTNSRIVKPSKEAEEKFVSPFLQSRKSILFLSGHCHAFEHFKVQGKDFLVIGGGGGLKQPLRQGIGALADLSLEYKPMYHYITVSILENGLAITSYHMAKDFAGFEEGIRLDITQNG